MFKELTGDVAILYHKGRYTQADLYEWEGGLFAKIGSSFVRLTSDGGTSVPGIVVKAIITTRKTGADKFGRIVLI